MGSWRFIGSFVMIIWVAVNTLLLGSRPFDPYPYILLNLFLSMLAELLHAGRTAGSNPPHRSQTARRHQRGMAQHDFDTNVASKSEIDRLLQLGEHKQMLAELHLLIQRLPTTPTLDENP